MSTTSTPPSGASPAGVVPRGAGEPPVVFFDGECGLCDRAVQWLVKRDKKRVLRYSPLQGETAREVVGELPADSSQWSMMLWDESGLHRNSTGALKTAQKLGGFWGLCGSLGLLFPRFIRDGVYRLVARNRLKWFGKPDACRIPSAEERQLFLP